MTAENTDANTINYALMGTDNHSPGLLRLLAEMKEREGGDPSEIEEIRTIADLMEEQGRKLGLPILTMESIASFAASLKKEAEPVPTPAAPSSLRGNLQKGEIVVAAAGPPCKLEHIFPDDGPEKVRGLANVRFPRAKNLTTVSMSNLRRATPDEQDAYQQAGGV
jgi:hypothetical protein